MLLSCTTLLQVSEICDSKLNEIEQTILYTIAFYLFRPLIVHDNSNH